VPEPRAHETGLRPIGYASEHSAHSFSDRILKNSQGEQRMTTERRQHPDGLEVIRPGRPMVTGVFRSALRSSAGALEGSRQGLARRVIRDTNAANQEGTAPPSSTPDRDPIGCAGEGNRIAPVTIPT